jgi:glycerol-3-phosphate O-acyltransferase/dihydroxyacetone phosphate acyltransferase
MAEKEGALTPPTPSLPASPPAAGREGASHAADRFFRALVRLVLRIFFREVEVVGAGRIPADRPLVLVANHVNGLVDPLLLIGPLPVTPRFLAKSTLWKNPAVRPFLDLAGAIPVYRKQDEGSDPAKNAETFTRSHDLLGRGGALALFPEGTSHSDPGLKPLKTGAARIVLEAERKYPGLGARIVPVGLLFDAKEAFRSRALVRVGEPIDPAPEIAQDAVDPMAAARALTARIDEELKEVTLNYETWEDARLIARAADLYRHRELSLPTRGSLAEGFAFRRAFLEGYRDLRARHPDKIAAVAGCVREYDALLSASGLRDDQVGAAYPPSPVLRFIGRTLLRLLVHLPLAVLGTVLNYPVYRLVGEIVKRVLRLPPDQTATFKVFGALLFFPLAWIAEGWLAGHYLGGYLGIWADLAVALLAPLTGYIALLFHDRRAIFWHEARAYLLLRTRKRLAEELRSRREAVLRQVEELAAFYEGDRRAGPT